MQQYICNNNTLIAFQKLGGLICYRACLSQSCTDDDPGTQQRPGPALLLRVAPPEPLVLAAAPRYFLEFQQCHPFWYTYYMHMHKINIMDA
jgi:hypothetical protein